MSLIMAPFDHEAYKGQRLVMTVMQINGCHFDSMDLYNMIAMILVALIYDSSGASRSTFRNICRLL